LFDWMKPAFSTLRHCWRQSVEWRINGCQSTSGGNPNRADQRHAAALPTEVIGSKCRATALAYLNAWYQTVPANADDCEPQAAEINSATTAKPAGFADIDTDWHCWRQRLPRKVPIIERHRFRAFDQTRQFRTGARTSEGLPLNVPARWSNPR
jgi:hypothetical protein